MIAAMTAPTPCLTTGRADWSVCIMGDPLPLATGLTPTQAEREAVDMMLQLGREWDCYCNLPNGQRAWILFRGA